MSFEIQKRYTPFTSIIEPLPPIPVVVQPFPGSMQWEYKWVRINHETLEEDLNRFGNEGWELEFMQQFAYDSSVVLKRVKSK